MSAEYVALYRKWRPKTFADVVGQEHITEVLSGEIKTGSVSHAYLFCGSRGTGKTTCAKIFARAVNCEHPVNGDPCGECETCRASENTFDIVEMDAASNNGVDEIRKLKEEVMYPPTEMRRKVYIIDEVHMLSASAFNALLKTLEEPPEHVIFILATTELNKIPITILSRCKRFDFHRITPEKIFGRLRMIADSEGIGIDDGALRLISRLASGAMRDALSMLEMFVGKEGTVDEKAAADTLGVVGREPVLALVNAIAAKDIDEALATLWRLYDCGKDLAVLCSECGELFRDMLMIKYTKNPESFLGESAAETAGVRAAADKFTADRLVDCSEILEATAAKLTRGAFSRRTVFETSLFKLCGIKLTDLPESVSERVASLEERLLRIEKNGVTLRTENAVGAVVDNSAKSVAENVEKSETVEKTPKAANIDSTFSDADIPPEDGEIAENPYADVPFDVDLPKEKKAASAAPKVEAGVKPVEKSVDCVEKSEKKDAGTESAAKNAVSAEGTKPVAEYREVIDALVAEDKMFISFLNGSTAFYSAPDKVKVELSGFAYTFITNSDAKQKQISDAFAKILGREVRVLFTQAKPKSDTPWEL